MTDLAMLWLPILLSAVFIFVASSILHMVLPVHRSDYRGMPNEDAVRDALRAADVPAGQYMFPHAESFAAAGSEEMQKKFAEGPVGILITRGKGMPPIGKSLLQWFVFCLVIGVIVAYLTGIGIAPGAAFGDVFRVAATTALLGHAFTTVNDSIWKGISWCTTAKFVFDGLIYALLTGVTFGWLWPAA